MDLQVVRYNHYIHWPIFWPVYRDFHKEANNLEGLETLITKETPQGAVVMSKLEDKLVDALTVKNHQIKILTDGVKCIGYLAYWFLEANVITIEGLYISPEHRKKGCAGLLTGSFPDVRRAYFNAHANKLPTAMLGAAKKANKLADGVGDDLDLYMIDLTTKGLQHG